MDPKLQLVIAIVNLSAALAPEALALILELAKDLKGLSADDIYGEARDRFEAIHQKAVAARAKTN